MTGPPSRLGFFGPGLHPLAPQRMGRLPRAWRALRSASSFIASEPSLSLLVAIAGTIDGAVAFAALLVILVRRSSTTSGAHHPVTAHQWALVGVSVATTAIVSVWLMGALTVRLLTFLRGEPVSVARASFRALAKLPRLLWIVAGHVVIAVTTQPLRRNGGAGGLARLFLGRRIAQQLRLRSALALPLVAGEGLKGRSRRRRSAQLLTEAPSAGSVITNPLSPAIVVGLGALAGGTSWAMTSSLVLSLTIGLLGFVVVGTLLAVASTSFWTALYIYLTNDAAPLGFQVDDLLAATMPRVRRRDRKRRR